MKHRSYQPSFDNISKTLMLSFGLALALCLCLLPLHGDEESGEPPLTWQEHLSLGQQAYGERDFEQAISHFEKAALESDDPYPLHLNRGLCHRALGEHQQAIEQLNKAMGGPSMAVDMEAQFQLGMINFSDAQQSLNSGNGQQWDLDKLKAASFNFQEVTDLGRRHRDELGQVHLDLAAKAKRNVGNISTKYKFMMDQESQQRGKKTNILQGSVKVNGRAVKNTRVHFKSKWERSIMGHALCDEGGNFTLEDLKPGKYQLAAALYDTDNPEDLEWQAPVKVPSREKDVQDLSVQGALTLASPYQSNLPSLKAPWDDHLREQGPSSIVQSTDWGELNDGFPESGLPADSDLHMAYVGFDQAELQLVMAVPSQEQQGQNPMSAAHGGAPMGPGGAMPPQGQPGMGHALGAPQASGNAQEVTPPPTFTITVKGYRDGERNAAPSSITVMGIKEGQDQPLTLYSSEVEVDATGTYSWQSEAFVHQGCRNLLMNFKRGQGERMIFHEVEVSEDLHQNQEDQQQDQQQDQQDNQDQQDQNQQQQDQQDQGGDQQDKQDQQDQQDQDQQQQESRSTRAILQKLREKNEEAKEKNAVRGYIIQTDKDY